MYKITQACFLASAFALSITCALATDTLTIDQIHSYFVEGLNQAENEKQIAIDELKSKINKIDLYGIQKEPPKVVQKEDAKQKSKVAIAREAKEKVKKEKRDQAESQKAKKQAIEELEKEIRTLSDQPSNWVPPVINIIDPQVGSIGSIDHLKMKVIQSVDDETAIVIWGGETTFYCKKLPANTQLIDGEFTSLPGIVVVDPPTRYTTAIGGTNTVRTFRWLSSDERSQLLSYVAEKTKASEPTPFSSSTLPAESR